MKRFLFAALLTGLCFIANALPTVNWNTNAEAAYRAAQSVVYDGSPGSGDASHVAAGNAILAGAGVDFLTLAAFRDFYGSGFTSAVTMGMIWFFANGSIGW